MERRARAELHIGTEHGRLARAFAQQVQKALEARVALVELVVAQGEGVKTHGVHQGCVGLAIGPCAVEVQRAGERVARVQLEHMGGLGRQLADGGCDAREAASVHRHIHGRRAAHRKFERLGPGLQRGVVVVDVQDGQLQRLALIAAVGAATGGQGTGRRQRQKAHVCAVQCAAHLLLNCPQTHRHVPAPVCVSVWWITKACIVGRPRDRGVKQHREAPGQKRHRPPKEPVALLGVEPTARDGRGTGVFWTGQGDFLKKKGLYRAPIMPL